MHTPEPWIIVYSKKYKQWNVFPKNHIGVQVAVASIYSGHERSKEEDKENARRIIACVNACAGLDTEALEQLVENGDTLQMPDNPSDVFVLTFAD